MTRVRSCERLLVSLHLHEYRKRQQTTSRYTIKMGSSSLPQRMRKLQTKLLSIRLGSGAFILPKDIKKIHLRFAPNMNGGHMGPRYAEIMRIST